jgi:hypothetical protein
MIQNVLFVSHKPSMCGIYQFGLRIITALKESKKYQFIYAECGSMSEYLAAIAEYQPVAKIVNYHPETMPWFNKSAPRIWPTIGIMHECSQSMADHPQTHNFDFHIAPDPTLVIRNKMVFKTGRLVERYNNLQPEPTTPTIGSFGFSLGGKNFERIISAVQNSFDHAIIRLNLPPATFGDSEGSISRMVAEKCTGLITKPGISIEIGYSYLDDHQLLEFLAKNSINAFLYDNMPQRGISSVIDYALAVSRPIAITKSNMFRHILSDSISIENSNLSDILKRGFSPLSHFKECWTPENIVIDYDTIITNILSQKEV